MNKGALLYQHRTRVHLPCTFHTIILYLVSTYYELKINIRTFALSSGILFYKTVLLMAQTVTLDEIDIKILRELQQNSRLTNKELAARIHLSTTPTFERHRRLEREGFIKQYTAIVDADKINRSFMVLCNISTNNIYKDKIDDFRERVANWTQVVDCYNVSGDFDFTMKVAVSSMKEYQEFIINEVGSVEYISKIQSNFIMDTLKSGAGVGL